MLVKLELSCKTSPNNGCRDDGVVVDGLRFVIDWLPNAVLAICDGLRSLVDVCVPGPPTTLPVTESLIGLVPNADALFLASSEALDRNVFGVGRFVEAGL